MKRRQFLAATGLALATPILSKAEIFDYTLHGCISEEPNSEPSLKTVAKDLICFGDNRVACLWRPYERITGKPWQPYQQKGPDCVGMAAGSGMDLLAAIQCVSGNDYWVAQSSTIMIYVGARQLISNYRKGTLGGVSVSSAVKYLKKYGNLLRTIICNVANHNLIKYNRTELVRWNKSGIPIALQEIAKEHPLLAAAPVKSWEEFRDAIAAGYPVVWSSNFYGGNDQRDKDGFIKDHRWRSWDHAWLGAGIDDGKRPGACLINSHGPKYGSGPKRHNQPDGSVWIDAETIDQICRNRGGSYALSLYQGFPKPEYVLW